MKRMTALLLSLCLALCPLLARADQTWQFSLNAAINPEAVSEEHRSLAQGLADGLQVMGFEGDITFNEDWKADLNLDATVDGQAYVNAHVQSNSEWISITSNLLGNQRIALMMRVYLEFAMKPYNYMGLPTQYLALLTSRFAHTDAWGPVIELCRPVLGGEGDRHIAAAQLVALAEEISAYVAESRAMRYWIIALCLDAGVDYRVMEMMETFPEWIQEAAGKDGLQITETPETETWILGGEEIFAITRDEAGHAQWQLTLPQREGYRVTASASWAEGGLLDGEVDVVYTLAEAEEEANVFTLDLTGSGLPDGQSASQADLRLTLGGYLTYAPVDVRIVGSWETAADGTIQARVALHDGVIEKVTLNGVFTPVETKQGLLEFTRADLEQGAVNAFTLNDLTLRELIDNIKGDVVKTCMPLLLKLPASFTLSVLDWLEDAGFTALLTEGL